MDAVATHARIWDNRVFSTSHAIHLSGGSTASIMRNAVRSDAGHGILVQASHTVVEGNQADSCGGFGIYLTSSTQYSSYGRNALQENFGSGCTGVTYSGDFCDEGSANQSFGDNLIPTLH